MKIHRFILIMATLIAVPCSCQKPEVESMSHSELVASLHANVGKPYSCTVHQTSRFLVSSDGEVGQIDMFSKLLFGGKNTSCELSEISAPGFPTLHKFQDRSDGLIHNVQESMPGDKWLCELWEQGDKPLGLGGLFPIGGWNICSQVVALLGEFGPSEMDLAGSVVTMSWPMIPENVKDQMLSQTGHSRFGDPAIKEVRLAVDTKSGFPVSFGIYFINGEFVSSTFEDVVFFEGEYSMAAEKLEAELELPDSFSCSCDYSDPIRQVKSRERAAGN